MDKLTDRLWFKLTIAFALVIVVGVMVTVVLTRQGTATQVAHFMVNNHMLRPVRLQAVLAETYREQGGWENLDAKMATIIDVAADGMMTGMMGNVMGMHNNRIQVVDADGIVVADSNGMGGGPQLTTQPVQSWPIMVNNQLVGTLLAEGTMMRATDAESVSLLVGVTRALLVAGLVAGVVTLMLAGLLVRQVTRPLASLTQASSRIASGDLEVRVPVQGKDELGALAISFNRMANNLETQEKLRRNLMADIAHELRTPLTGIQGTVEALEDGIFPPTPENFRSIHEQVLLLNRLVEDLRVLTNAEAGQLSLDRLPLDLAELTRQQVTTFQPQAALQNITLALHVKGKLPIIAGDGQRLSQVLNNLLDNALRHTPPGGTVEIYLAAERNGICISIIDSGEGITPVDLPHIFDRFYRVDHARNRQTGGSGLGLAIARQLVTVHHGKIWAESPTAGRDRGSVFHVWLPASGIGAEAENRGKL